jgi:hypothetical protein
VQVADSVILEMTSFPKKKEILEIEACEIIVNPLSEQIRIVNRHGRRVEQQYGLM